MNKQLINTSKMLSLVLRHQPQTIGLQLDEEGWANVEELLQKMNVNGNPITMELLNEVVETNDKKRFAFNNDKTCIRASQGHSIEVELNLQPVTPPTVLYHGTVEKFITAIQQHGLQKMNRQHVHLSTEKETAIKVGTRRGKPIILTIDAAAMYSAGHQFYLSANGVWLTEAVPPQYIMQ